MATIRRLRGRWQAMVRKCTVHRCRSFNQRRDAIAWATELEAAAVRAGPFGDARLAHRTTLGSVLLRYRDQCSPSKRGARSEQARLAAMAREPIAALTLAKLSSPVFASYRDERLKMVAPATVVRELSLIQTVLEIATREWGIPLPCNPLVGVRRPAVCNERKRRLERDEESRLLAAARAARSGWMHPVLVTAIETAMRRSELLALRWDDIAFEHRVAHVRLSKNGEPRDIPLSVRAVETLKGLRRNRVNDGRSESDGGAFESRDGDYVFPFSTNAVRRAFERIRARAGCTDLRFHDLRREAVTRFIERGLSMIEAAYISGHRDVRMLSRYVAPRVESLLIKLDRTQELAA